VGVWVEVGVTACAGVLVTFTVVVLLELHPAMAAAASAAVAIAQISFVLSISPPRVAQRGRRTHYFAPGRADVGIGDGRLDAGRASSHAL
jgi:hypothetical protein